MNLIASFEKATNCCELLRPQLPKVYNKRRPKEQPIPSVEPTLTSPETFETTETAKTAVEAESDQQTDDEHVQGEGVEVNSDSEQSGQAIVETGSEHENVATDFIIHEEPYVENAGNGEIVAQDELQQQHELDNESIACAEETDPKFSLSAVDVDLEDQLMMTALFDADGATDALKGIQLEEDEKAEVCDGKIIVTKTFGNDLEMVYTYGEKPKALQPLYHIKLNDAISENIPFKENVCTIIVFR